MYCPRCSQQQVSEETKFCSRCGFPLGLVSEILSHGGFLPQLADLYKSKKILTKSNVMKFGLIWFLFWSFLMTPLLAIAGGEEIVAVTAVLGFVGGLILVVLAALFLKNEPKIIQENLLNQNINSMPVQLRGNHIKTALPPQQSQPAQSYVPPIASWKAPDTGDFVRPPSVTEGTTKLLEKDE
jgi:hypothetical protein